jgi:glycosyltransferase involved in cell wall biosynthesis
MIYLNAEVVSGLGEDTFWTWFKREFPSSRFGLPRRLHSEDIVLQYSTLGFANRSGKSLALLWELLPQMKEVLRSDMWDERLQLISACARFSTWRTTPTPLTRRYYDRYGSVDVLPIGVDAELFKPLPERRSLREKYGIPVDRQVGIWVGTSHPMKGFARMVETAQRDPRIYWIVVWKWEAEAGHFHGGSNFTKVPQPILCELFNCADFYLSCSLLPSFFMAEWEAMACNLPIHFVDETLVKDFVPSANPRDDVFRWRWDRKSARDLWAGYLESKGVTW